MNRLFNIVTVGAACVLSFFFLFLVGSMIVELYHETAVKAPRSSEIFFAIRLSWQ